MSNLKNLNEFMAKVAWQAGIDYVSGALCKCGKKAPHKHGRMLLATHRRAATTSDSCNRIYLRFLAQRNNPRGKKTMKAYYWYICGLEWDSEHPRP